MKRNPYKQLETALGYRFSNRALLQQALTHPSYRHEQAEETGDNQRLEFLGDAALALAAAQHLYEQTPPLTEGRMSELRGKLASSTTLTQMARDLVLGPYLKLGKGELLSGGDARPSNLEDALESVIGAAYLDGGLKAVQAIFVHLFADRIADTASPTLHDNPKGTLQEYAQKKFHIAPLYATLDEMGPSHERWYQVAVLIDEKEIARGEGRTKREAEAAAARAALATLVAVDTAAQ